MSNDNGSWLPYEVGTNEVHECRKSRQSQPTTQQQPRNNKQSITLESLDKALKDIDSRLKIIEDFYLRDD